MFTKPFWKDASERAVRTFAQTLLALIVVGPLSSVLAINWDRALATAGVAALVSVLNAIVAPPTQSVPPADLTPLPLISVPAVAALQPDADGSGKMNAGDPALVPPDGS